MEELTLSNLKQEMRSMFERKDPLLYEHIYGKSLEDGLLRKIINFAYINLKAYKPKESNMLAVQSLKAKHRLFSMTDNNNIMLEAFVTLIVLMHPDENSEHYLDMLSMSIMYAAKYFSVDFACTTKFDQSKIKEEFARDTESIPVMLISLGHFSTGTSFNNISIYESAVREV